MRISEPNKITQGISIDEEAPVLSWRALLALRRRRTHKRDWKQECVPQRSSEGTVPRRNEWPAVPKVAETSPRGTERNLHTHSER